jgi:hypothetical protein
MSGLPWLKGQTKEFALSSLGPKILCTTHNSQLSPLDLEARKFLDSALDIRKHLIELNKKKPHERLRKKKYQIDGRLLERWMFKFLIGISCEGQGIIWHESKLPALSPPKVLLEGVFGLAEFPPPIGLYFSNAIDEHVRFEESQGAILHLETHINPDSQGLASAELLFNGLGFYLLATSDLGKFGRVQLSSGRDVSIKDLVYHPNNIQLNSFRSSFVAASIDFDWESNVSC